MKVKESVLKILTENMGTSISGERIALQLGVSRTAVWKAVHSLKSQGYVIDNKHGTGYTLSPFADKMWHEAIYANLGTTTPLDIRVLKEVDSTNNYLKMLAVENLPEGVIILAENQTSGRGRLGRKFHTPQGKGIYMSILLRPAADYPVNTITALAAVAVSKTLLEETGIPSKIKWVNDIYMDNKKVCGILTEAGFTAESGVVDWAIVGIGINVSTTAEDMPSELENVFTSVLEEGFSIERNYLAARIITQFFDLYQYYSTEQIIAIYKKNQLVMGKNLTVTNEKTSYPAKAVDMDSLGHLIVENEDGERITLISGEVSVRDWD